VVANPLTDNSVKKAEKKLDVENHSNKKASPEAGL
jgi:hypothetical protein